MHQDLNEEEWTQAIQNDESAVVIDVRTPEEWEMGIQKNAILLDYFDSSNLLKNLNEMDQSKTYFVYCKAGGRSMQVCQAMQQMGFKNTVNLLGGMSVWRGEVVAPNL